MDCTKPAQAIVIAGHPEGDGSHGRRAPIITWISDKLLFEPTDERFRQLEHVCKCVLTVESTSGGILLEIRAKAKTYSEARTAAEAFAAHLNAVLGIFATTH